MLPFRYGVQHSQIAHRFRFLQSRKYLTYITNGTSKRECSAPMKPGRPARQTPQKPPSSVFHSPRCHWKSLLHNVMSAWLLTIRRHQRNIRTEALTTATAAACRVNCYSGQCLRASQSSQDRSRLTYVEHCRRRTDDESRFITVCCNSFYVKILLRLTRRCIPALESLVGTSTRGR